MRGVEVLWLCGGVSGWWVRGGGVVVRFKVGDGSEVMWDEVIEILGGVVGVEDGELGGEVG